MRGQHQWHHRFSDKGCRWTGPREIILGFLSRSLGHLSAKDIYAALYPSNPGLGLTTVYRTLELLHGLGVVRKVAAGDGQGRYEIRNDGPKGHHHHLICTRCSKIINYRDFVQEELELVKKTEDALTKKYNFAIQDHNIEFLGLCEKCR